MAIVVEDGTGKSDGNSFCTDAFGVTYNTERNTTATGNTWTANAQPIREAYLIRATDMLSRLLKWDGQASTSTQRLPWPRGGAADRNGNSIDNDEVPLEVQEATAELAHYLISNNFTAPVDSSLQGIEKVVVDTVEVDFDPKMVANRPLLPPYIVQMVAHLTTGTWIQRVGTVGRA